MSFLAYYLMMLVLSVIANYFIQGPQRLIDEEEGITD